MSASPGGPEGHNVYSGLMLSACGRPGDAGVAPTDRAPLQEVLATLALWFVLVLSSGQEALLDDQRR